MRKELLYEKHYPRESIDDLIAAAELHKEQRVISKCANSEELLACLYKGVEYRYLPKRRNSAKRFIEAAVKTADLYEINTNIWRYEDHITVEYCFDCAGAMGFLKDTIIYADDIAFFSNINGYDIIIQIDHYTHAVYRNGYRVRP